MLLRRPWATIAQDPIEGLDLDGASYDHVLVLRSYNHLRDPGETLARLTRALRPGGTLIVADNVAFGLVREQPQVRRAESGPAIFEHYRNDGSEHAAQALAGLPLDLITRADVRAGTSNQWYLRYRRRGDA